MTGTSQVGYDRIQENGTTILVRSEWKSLILRDLLEDFHGIPVERRRVYGSGRAEHFSYLPEGALDRVFVRRAARGGILSRLGNLHFGVERPRREIRASEAAARAGIPVPEIVAARATRVFGPFHRLTIVMREIADASNLLHLGPTLSPGPKRRVLERLADLLRRMHDEGIYHNDLTLRNILLDAERNLYIIDLDEARLLGTRDPRSDVALLSRLNRSVEKMLRAARCVTRTDKLRFLRRYTGRRDGLRELSARCTSGLWFHRLWWSLSGQA